VKNREQARSYNIAPPRAAAKLSFSLL